MATKVKLIADNAITTTQIDTSSLDSHFTGGTGVTYSSGTISIGQAVHSTDSPTFADLTITGNLNITGDINSYNVTDLDVTDQTITLGAGQIEANSGGSGIIVAGSEASILWDETNDWWDYNKGIRLDGEGLKLSFRTSSTSADGEIYTGDTFGSNRLIISGENGIHNVIDGNANGVGDWSVYNDNTSTHLLYVIGSNGYVGIGDSSPNVKLVVSTASGDTALAINDDRSNVADYARIDFRHNNITGSQIKSQAIEDFSVDANRTADLSFHTRNNGTIIDAMHIQEDGKVGIGIDSPLNALSVTGVITSGNFTSVAIGGTPADLNTAELGPGYLNLARDDTANAKQLLFGKNGAIHSYFETTTSGLNIGGANVGIGTTNPQGRLSISGPNTGSVPVVDIIATGTGTFQRGVRMLNSGMNSGDHIMYALGRADNARNMGQTYFYFDSAGSTSNRISMGLHSVDDVFNITGTGNVGIDTTNPQEKLHVEGSVLIDAYNQGAEEGIFFRQGFSSSNKYNMGIMTYAHNGSSNDGITIGAYNGFSVSTGSNTRNERFRISSTGAVSVVGSLSKGSGSFKIDHPLESKTDTHHLVHSFIEGPQADLIYRGKVDLVDGSATVNIDTVAGMTEGTFVTLNREVQCFTSNESDWDAVKGSISGNILTIECQNTSSTATVSWLVIGERQDPHMYDTEWTDEDGKVIVEPLKETVAVEE